MDGGMVWHGWWNGVDRELAYVNTDVLLKPSYNYNELQLALFSYFRLNFVADGDVMIITTQSSKHDVACISLQFSVKLSSAQHTHISSFFKHRYFGVIVESHFISH